MPKPEKGMDIYLDSFLIPLGTDAFILTMIHSPDLAYSTMATQLPGTYAVFSSKLRMTSPLCSVPPLPVLRSRL